MKLLVLFTIFISSCGKIAAVSPISVSKVAPITCREYQGYNYNTLVDFTQITPSGYLILNSLNFSSTINPLQPESTFQQNFALSCTTTLHIPYTTTYTIQLNADNGARVFLNEVKILDGGNSNTILQQSVNEYLIQGPYQLQVDFFNAGGPYQLEFQWSYNGQPVMLIPDDNLTPSNSNQMIE